LLLFCGAGIRPAAQEIADAFGERHAVTVECDFAGSEVLLSRIELTGEGDLYMPGDVYYVEQAREKNLIASTATACYFIPVILVQKDNPKNIRSVADLTRPGVRVGLGDSKTCAIGRTSAAIFANSGLREEDVARNVVVRTVTVNELGNQIKLGMLDAVIVWDAMAAYFADHGDVVPIPPKQNVVSTVAVGVLRSTQHPELAQALLDFIASDEGQAIFQRHHYSIRAMKTP
jgi:molybdate transport system substrate-binding protein